MSIDQTGAAAAAQLSPRAGTAAAAAGSLSPRAMAAAAGAGLSPRGTPLTPAAAAAAAAASKKPKGWKQVSERIKADRTCSSVLEWSMLLL